MTATPEPPERAGTPDPQEADFENRLTVLLHAGAEALDVQPDLDALMATSDRPRSSRGEGSRRWLAVAAVAAVLGAIGVGRASQVGETTAAGVTAADETAIDETVIDETVIDEEGDSQGSGSARLGESLLIWLDVGVTPTQVAGVAEALRSLPEVTQIRYVGPEETWQAFSEYFADQPEVIELVEQDQLPTSFEVTSSDPSVVAAAVESLPGVDAIDREDLTPDRAGTSDATTEGDDESADPPADPGILASATGATTIVFGGPTEPVQSWDNHLLVWQGGVTTRIGPFANPWIDDGFIIDRVSDSGPTRVYDLAGQPVCEVKLPDLANVHHVTSRADETVVLGVEQGIGDEADYRTEAFALDCETGVRTPIEPFTEHLGDGEWVRIERIGERVFEVHGDAEGNADPILNEDGVDIVGDDWAGQLAWSADGSVLAYGNHRDAASPHVTSKLAVRDTRTGELLWETELPQVISRLIVIGDRLVVGQGEDRGGWVPTESIAVHDLRLRDETGPALMIDQAPPGLIYLD